MKRTLSKKNLVPANSLSGGLCRSQLRSEMHRMSNRPKCDPGRPETDIQPSFSLECSSEVWLPPSSPPAPRGLESRESGQWLFHRCPFLVWHSDGDFAIFHIPHRTPPSRGVIRGFSWETRCSGSGGFQQREHGTGRSGQQSTVRSTIAVCRQREGRRRLERLRPY